MKRWKLLDDYLEKAKLEGGNYSRIRWKLLYVHIENY